MQSVLPNWWKRFCPVFKFNLHSTLVRLTFRGHHRRQSDFGIS